MGEARLAASEARFRAMIEGSLDLIFVLGPQARDFGRHLGAQALGDGQAFDDLRCHGAPVEPQARARNRSHVATAQAWESRSSRRTASSGAIQASAWSASICSMDTHVAPGGNPLKVIAEVSNGLVCRGHADLRP